jgi:hypothetical protein
VTWQAKRRRTSKLEGQQNWRMILRWPKGPCHDYAFVDLTRSPQCFLWKRDASCKSYIRNKNYNLYHKHFQITGLYATSVNMQWANFEISHKSLFGQNHTKLTDTLIWIIKSSLKAGGTHSNHCNSKGLIAYISHFKKCRRFLLALHGIRAIDYYTNAY